MATLSEVGGSPPNLRACPLYLTCEIVPKGPIKPHLGEIFSKVLGQQKTAEIALRSGEIDCAAIELDPCFHEEEPARMVCPEGMSVHARSAGHHW